MATIRPSADLRNNYNEISQFCRDNREPVFITKNGHGDLAIMSMEVYRQLTGSAELYKLIDEGLEALNRGEVQPLDEAMADIRRELAPYGV